MSRRTAILVGVVLAALTLALFGRTCFHGFVNPDDDAYVTENASLGSGLSRSGLGWALTTFHASNWHPLTWVSLMLDHQVYGLNPWGYHLTNVLLHSANTVLLFL